MSKDIVVPELIEQKILYIHGHKVLLDKDLSVLYGVDTKQLKRQVKRNIDRFPNDFMFELTTVEYTEYLRSQFGTLAQGKYSKYLPYAFTEQGVAMLSSVLKSKRAIQVNIQIMRTFINLRKLLSSNADLLKKIEAMEKKYDTQFKIVFETIKQLLDIKVKPKTEIGFKYKK